MPSRPVAAGSPSDAPDGRSRDEVTGYRPCVPPQAASARAVEYRRFGVPPGGLRGPPSSSHNASRMASILTGAFNPCGARNAGHEAIAEASEAQEARIARFSASVRSGCDTTSLGCSKTVPGCSSAWKSKTLSWVAVVGRMFSSIRRRVGGSPIQRGRAAAGYSLKPPWLRADGRCSR
jgi:hypothetical protein